MFNIKQRFIAVVTITLVVTFIVISAHSLDVLQRNEWIAYDQLLSTKRTSTPAPDDIIVVLIDDASLQFMDPLVGRWPWPRSVFADVIDYISLGNPQTITFDMLFVERQFESNSPDESGDRRLISSTATVGNVIHAMQFINDSQDEVNTLILNKTLPDVIVNRNNIPVSLNTNKNSTDFADWKVYNNFLTPIDGLYQNALATGVVSVEPDPDGILRRTSLLFRYQSSVFPALSIAPLAQQYKNRTIVSNNIFSLGNANIPMDRNGNFLVNFYPRFHTFSMSGVLSSIAALNQGDVENIIIHPEEFQGKYVFIGSSAVGLHDLKTTPLGNKQPGVFLHASVLANVLHNDFLLPPHGVTTWLAVLLASLATVLGVLYIKHNIMMAISPLLTTTVVAGWCYWQFSHNQVVAIVQPLLAIALSWTLTYTYLLFTEGREKNKIRKMFSQYVSPAALSAMIDNYDDYKHAGIGSKENVTMLFSDIRNFTSLSETLPPEKVVEMLNHFFSNMTLAILEHNGTIDKFIGDSIMATWGAPIKSGTHATDAVLAALTMIEKLRTVNQWLEQHQLDAIDIGIGVHTGEVILGSIGSDQKADYTVIGDNVNLASRLEGATKIYGCPLLLSEKTYELLEDVPCAMIDIIRVKGKKRPVKIYTPLSQFIKDRQPGREDDPEILRNMQQAFNAYVHQSWEHAISLFRLVPNRRLGELYIARCEQFMCNPPPPDWDGVYTLENK